MSKEGKISLTPEELEYAFAQAARFGGFMFFLYNHREVCKSVFEKNLGKGAEFSFDVKDSAKKNAMIELVKAFESKSHGKELMNQLSDLYKAKQVWDHVETFGFLCAMSRQPKQDS